ncbi:L-2-hydroxyglutarate dehydrogenase [Cordyceps fumosorosea ARSEF 2679]|uniref:L-2-hydroxyglutarate dehydrogenase, mitochondrial n=1 Tax=Cordyceps fumosorosea (strain ARSEF 2679) TaxID=1081104 RepID=A0A167UCX1_CORFA|nr:L-2-hydroxyglutarate dehydrogenase [Cordyceps fumosorosea ARSEF 2679]OAA61460.1 L-2-hydroxyglutarate dehydrogenase [Cordyceps fumosorosea ARSEF 2679]
MASNIDTSAPQRPESPTGSPRGPSTTSLQAAATVNAGLNRELSPRKPHTLLKHRILSLNGRGNTHQAPAGSSTGSLTRGQRSSSNAGRRRSNVLMNLQLNNPSIPGPGEMVSESGIPQHHRAPSLGELHQELEAEQEAHVNRLLQMIRQQQLELQRLQANNPNHSSGHGASAEDSSAVSDRPAGPSSHGPSPAMPLGSYPRSPVFHHRPSLDMARADLHRRSRTPSRGASPRLRSTSISAESGDWALGGRDESAFYQAEAQMLTRENQMLKHRINDLQKQLNELSASQGSNEPPNPSGLVIGGGVVGIAVARQLARRSGGSTVLIERHPALGTETSARNSEVIHAGIYYAPGSLKARLCVRGKQLLYDLCARHDVGHRRTGKWIVAQTPAQRASLERFHAACRDTLGVPTRWVSAAEVARDGEGVVAAEGALDSPTTGIVDSHALMACLAGLLEEDGGIVALNSPVVGVRPEGGGWAVDVRDGPEGEASTITADTVVNAAGLGAAHVHNMIVGPERRVTLRYAKGNYFSYAASRPAVSRLIYPVPEPGLGGLGTHLTLDLAGRMRFGPDVEWVDGPDDLAALSTDTPRGASRLREAVAAIRTYLPGIDPDSLAPDYAGIRPKLVGPDHKGFVDFVIREEDGFPGWVNLLGIESPGLTSALAIAERVEEMMYGNVSGG